MITVQNESLTEVMNSQPHINWLVFNVPSVKFSKYWQKYYECIAIGFIPNKLSVWYIDRFVDDTRLRCHCTHRTF